MKLILIAFLIALSLQLHNKNDNCIYKIPTSDENGCLNYNLCKISEISDLSYKAGDDTYIIRCIYSFYII